MNFQSLSPKELTNFGKFLLKNRWWLCGRSYCVPYTYKDIYSGEVTETFAINAN